MEQALQGYEDALDNTVQIARLCEYEMAFGRYKYPVFQVQGGKNLNELLTEDSREGLKERLVQKKGEEGELADTVAREYRDRLDFELGKSARVYEWWK